MNEISKQQLSALLDGDLGDQETRFLLRRIEADPALAELWSRYLLIGDSLRKQTHVPMSGVFVTRVMQQLQSDPAVARPHRAGRWLRYGLGGSIAASVTIAALVWMQPQTRQQLPAQADSGNMQMAAPAIAEVTAPATMVQAAETAPDYSALMLQSRSPLLQVQPASAVIRQQPMTLGGQRNLAQPIWMRHMNNAPRQDNGMVALDFSSIVARRHADPPRMPVARH